MNLSYSPFDIMKLCFTKEHYLSDEELQGYSQFMMNKILSCDDKLCYLAASLNTPMTDRAHFDCLFYGLVKLAKPKYIPYLAAKPKVEKEIGYVSEFFSIDRNVAKQYLELMNEEEKKKIIDYFEKRGKLK
jgi:hypothetical protein